MQAKLLVVTWKRAENNSARVCLVTFRDGVALFESIESGSERVEGAKLNDFAEPVEVRNGVPNRFGVLADFIDAVNLEQAVARSGFVEKEQRHC